MIAGGKYHFQEHPEIHVDTIVNPNRGGIDCVLYFGRDGKEYAVSCFMSDRDRVNHHLDAFKAARNQIIEWFNKT